MNMSSTYLSHIDGFSDPNAISSNYFIYKLVNTGDSGEPLLVLILVGIYQIPSLSRLFPHRKSTFSFDYRDVGVFFPYHSKCLISWYFCEQTYYAQTHHLVGMNESVLFEKQEGSRPKVYLSFHLLLFQRKSGRYFLLSTFT